ncbi:MAG: two-component system response regulator (stage 0 sporulation protein A) [Clostridium sp.]|jgi:two-component system response regulator (stage 0 sporulation protein A)
MEERKLNIIIADDNKEFCSVLNDYLLGQKDIVVTGIANNGIEVLKLIEEKRPDLVVLDMIMPIIDGLGVLKKLNTMDLASKPRIIALSVVTQEKIIQKAISLGADYYVVKPFDMEVLIKKIRYLLKK